jgi:hypothetical protein
VGNSPEIIYKHYAGSRHSLQVPEIWRVLTPATGEEVKVVVEALEALYSNNLQPEASTTTSEQRC